LWSPPSCAHNDVVRAAPIFDPQQHHPRDDVVIPNSVVGAPPHRPNHHQFSSRKTTLYTAQPKAGGNGPEARPADEILKRDVTDEAL
jgi:hypothetical protein